MAYLGFEITGANKKKLPVFPIDHFLYTLSYKPILSVIQRSKRKLFKGATKLNFYGFLNPQSLTLNPLQNPEGTYGLQATI